MAIHPVMLYSGYTLAAVPFAFAIGALAARRLGWVDVPLLCGNELAVRMPNPRGVGLCVRVLILYNTEKRQAEMRHVYLRGAQAIKRDLEQYRSQLDGVIR